MFQKIGLLCITLLLLLSVAIVRSSAQSSPDVSSRVFRLESETFNLRSQINRLELQVNRLSSQQQDGGGVANRQEAPADPPLYRPTLPGEDQFDRLATLVIELKQQVNDIEARLSAIESQRSTQTPS